MSSALIAALKRQKQNLGDFTPEALLQAKRAQTEAPAAPPTKKTTPQPDVGQGSKSTESKRELETKREPSKQAIEKKSEKVRKEEKPKPPNERKPETEEKKDTPKHTEAKGKGQSTGAVDASTRLAVGAAAGLTELQAKMVQKLAGAQFRYINEQLYTTTSDEAFNLMQSDPSRFIAYHEGFRAQVEKWPLNPVDHFIKYLRKHPGVVVGDFGCGDAKIGKELKSTHKVYSFDLVSVDPIVTACDISNVPLADNTLDVAIFSLALMGTNFLDFLREAHRTLKPYGMLKIAEVRSRFDEERGGVEKFIRAVCQLGFEHTYVNTDNKMFILLDFKKIPVPTGDESDADLSDASLSEEIPRKRSTSATSGAKQSGEKSSKRVQLSASSQPLLKPCIYKRR